MVFVGWFVFVSLGFVFWGFLVVLVWVWVCFVKQIQEIRFNVLTPCGPEFCAQ